MNITYEEWQAELARCAEESVVAGFTVAETAAAMGRSIHFIRGMIRLGIQRGTIAYAGTRPSTRIDGRDCRVPVYRLRKPAKVRRSS
jgi:hypothetical protein